MVSVHEKMSEICPPDFSIWTTEDDLLLKNAVEAGAALEALAKGAVRFSCRFTIKELQERWHALLYIPEISAKAAARMVEFELSQMELSKPTRSSKLKSNEEFVRKQRPESLIWKEQLLLPLLGFQAQGLILTIELFLRWLVF